MLCELVPRYQRFEETYCLHLQGRAAGIADGLSPAVNMTQENIMTKMKANQNIFIDFPITLNKHFFSLKSSKVSALQ
jgi:hypothetical protein